ncbi:UNVERIFIED_CONTAM: hypothetical protein Scaly_2920000 [Sesamum calycinum]|uniref:Uncharacterized protein n=1 Tax=Sesamum calycinum TaxID=2727403 RepID=A0AAW2L121_9LAMI
MGVNACDGSLRASDDWWNFNIVLNSSERKGGARPKLYAMEDFADAILDCNLTDASFEGSEFTWTNFKMWQWLDWVLYSPTWADFFTNTRVQYISRTCSDHHLSSLNIRKPSSFRFLNMWVRHHRFWKMLARIGQYHALKLA